MTTDSNPDPDALVTLERVGVTYPNGTVALRPTRIAFRRGEFSVLLGLSGAGKSTMLRAVNQLVAPTAGHVVSAAVGRLVSRRAVREHRRRTAMVFQQHQLLARCTALTNVLTGRLGYHGTLRSLFPLPETDVALALECLERVGLGGYALTRVDNLSGGQMQRVGVARALAQRPEIILADEPVASLDPTTATKVLRLLQRICREDGIAAVVSLHQVELARRFADRVVGLARGTVVFDGSPESLREEHLDVIYDRERQVAVRETVAAATDSGTERPVAVGLQPETAEMEV